MAVVAQLSDRLQTLYADQVVAIALYGSMASQQDGPCSDIELLCFVSEPDNDETFEWIYGPGKAEINVLGRNDARWEADEVELDWAISKGAFLDAQLVFGDPDYLAELKQLVLSVSDKEIHSVLSQAIVDELYEWIGKARNALHSRRFSGVPSLAHKFTETVALLLGLAHRTCYTTGMTMLAESLQFDSLPGGYQDLCNLVQQGDLRDAEQTIAALEAAWSGFITWATEHNIHVEIAPWPFTDK